MDPAELTIPVTVIGGYLGAGKTTLINHLLRNADGRKLAILVNEFGELPIDEDLIEAESDDLISLAGGCICCSYGNDLVAALVKLADTKLKPDHVVIESSGVAIPSSIAGSVSILEGYSLDGVIVLVDAQNVLERASDTYLSDTILRQLTDSNIVLLNKADLVSGQQLTELKYWLADNAQGAHIIATSNSRVPLEVVLQSQSEHYISSFDTKPKHLEGFETKTIFPDRPLDLIQFGNELIEKNPDLVRVKGFAKNLSGEIKTIQIVGKYLNISDAPTSVSPGIVLIFQKNNTCL
ncbi:MAG: GTP-binding protein [Rhizobiaceae bacterium]|nr:GTP-binding protein [Rhizobiaceae bacterium]